MADTWIDALDRLGFDVRTIAAEGNVDLVLADLAIGRWPDGAAGLHGPDAASSGEIEELARRVATALADVDLVVVENLGSLPMNLPAAMAVARACVDRRTIWHHHDPAWQRDRYGDVTELPPREPAPGGLWRHVTINDLTRRQFLDRGIEATTIRNGFDVHPASGDRDRERRRLGFSDDDLVMVHPVRAIARKNVPAAIDIAERVGATYWLTGPAEEDYGAELERVLADARRRGLTVVHEPSDSLADMYAACDVVVFPSTWEGFGNPPIDAAIHRRPAIVGHYPVGEELRSLGFEWFDPEHLDAFMRWVDAPDEGLLDRNRAVVESTLSLEALDRSLGELLDEAGWTP